MEYSLRVRGLNLTAMDQQLLDKKLERLERHVPTPFSCSVDIEHDQHHRKGAVVLCRVNITSHKKTYHVERSAETVQDAMDQVLEALRHDLERDHDKHKEQHDQ